MLKITYFYVNNTRYLQILNNIVKNVIWISPSLSELTSIIFQYGGLHIHFTFQSSVCKKWYHTYHNSLENLNQCIYKLTRNFLHFRHLTVESKFKFSY